MWWHGLILNNLIRIAILRRYLSVGIDKEIVKIKSLELFRTSCTNICQEWHRYVDSSLRQRNWQDDLFILFSRTCVQLAAGA